MLLFGAGCSRPSREATELTGPARRIVSLAPAFTEMLFELGLGERVVGVTRYCSHPAEAKSRPKVGGFADPDLEMIVALQPDVVLGVPERIYAPLYNKLRSVGIAVLEQPIDRLAEIQRAALAIGQIAEAPERGERLAQDMAEGLDSVRASVVGLKRPKVIFIVGFDPLVVVGGSSYIDELIEIAGGQNVARGERRAYLIWSYEQMLMAAPEVIVNAAMGTDAAPEMIEQVDRIFSRWRVIPAVANGRVHLIDFSLATTPGPRVVETARLLARIFHRELAGEPGEGR